MDIGITMGAQGCGAAGSTGDTVCLERAELQDLLRRVRGLERMIGRVLGAKLGTSTVASSGTILTTGSGIETVVQSQSGVPDGKLRQVGGRQSSRGEVVAG